MRIGSVKGEVCDAYGFCEPESGEVNVGEDAAEAGY